MGEINGAFAVYSVWGLGLPKFRLEILPFHTWTEVSSEIMMPVKKKKKKKKQEKKKKKKKKQEEEEAEKYCAKAFVPSPK